MKRALPILAGVALIVVLVIGLTQASDSSDGGGPTSAGAPKSAFDPEQARRALAGAPPELAALHAQGNQLLGGGRKAFDARVRALRGRPIVVNAWASWCGPCRSEFPDFQRLSVARGKEIAFLGLNTANNAGEARDFLKKYPVPYPSYRDPHYAIGRSLGAAQGLPQTVFIDREGEVAYIHPGQYRSQADLQTDIERYLGA